MTRTEKIIENSKKNIEKLNKTIERHQARKAKLISKLSKLTDDYEISWCKSDIEDCDELISARIKDLAVEQEKLQRWEEKLKIEQEKDVCPVKAIEDFLLNWEKKAKEYYMKESQEYIKEYKLHKYALENLYENESLDDEYHTLYHSEMDRFYKWKEKYVSAVTDRVTNPYKGTTDTEKLESIIHQEKVRKSENLVDRVTNVVGEITDATGLYVANNLELNGKITGTKCSATVTTIYAGGYAVQCLHFRTLINPIK